MPKNQGKTSDLEEDFKLAISVALYWQWKWTVDHAKADPQLAFADIVGPWISRQNIPVPYIPFTA